jgi:hypothetical protein
MNTERRRREIDGRYANEQRCDEVCGGGDGPGFYLCARERCVARCATMTVAERAAYYRRREGRKGT